MAEILKSPTPARGIAMIKIGKKYRGLASCDQ